MTPRLLIIDDDEAICRLVAAMFRDEAVVVVSARDGRTGIEIARAQDPDVVLLDLRLPDLDGLAILERLRAETPSLPVIMLTGSRDVQDAVSAMKLGAFDYLTKPVIREEVVIAVHRAAEDRAMRSELTALRRRAEGTADETLSAQMGASQAIQRVIEQVGLVAASTLSVLIVGETGSGKELIAQALHRQSDRRLRPFVALDCGAIPDALLESELFGHEKGAFTGAERRQKGRFRLAEGGTCFLDEFGNLPLPLQAKLLRVLEAGEVQAVGAERATPMDVRFVAATNQDLQTRVEAGAFRADLYFRLAQYTIEVPPLRERPEDIPFLTRRFVEQASTELRHPIEYISPRALEALIAHAWPGNVRELRNVVRQAVLRAPGLSLGEEDVRIASGGSRRASRPAAAAAVAGGSLREIAARAASIAEREAICDALRGASGNKAAAARALRTDYKTLHLKIKDMGIDPHEFRGRGGGE